MALVSQFYILIWGLFLVGVGRAFFHKYPSCILTCINCEALDRRQSWGSFIVTWLVIWHKSLLSVPSASDQCHTIQAGGHFTSLPGVRGNIWAQAKACGAQDTAKALQVLLRGFNINHKSLKNSFLWGEHIPTIRLVTFLSILRREVLRIFLWF